MAYGTSDTHKQLKNDMPKSLVGLYASINQYLLDTFTALALVYQKDVPGTSQVHRSQNAGRRQVSWRSIRYALANVQDGV
jgi:hypothetical protein